MALLESVSWLVLEGIFPTTPAAFMGIRRGQLPEEAIVRRGRRLLIRPDVVRRWVAEGCPQEAPPDPRGNKAT